MNRFEIAQEQPMKLLGMFGLARWSPAGSENEKAHRRRCYLRAHGYCEATARVASGLDVSAAIPILEREIADARRCSELGLEFAITVAEELRYHARMALAGAIPAALWNGAYESTMAGWPSKTTLIALSTQEPPWAREALDRALQTWHVVRRRADAETADLARANVLLQAENHALRTGLPMQSKSHAQDVVTLLCDAAIVTLRLALAGAGEDMAYLVKYSVGATEQQDERPWEYKNEVEATEVRRMMVLGTSWEPTSKVKDVSGTGVVTALSKLGLAYLRERSNPDTMAVAHQVDEAMEMFRLARRAGYQMPYDEPRRADTALERAVALKTHLRPGALVRTDGFPPHKVLSESRDVWLIQNQRTGHKVPITLDELVYEGWTVCGYAPGQERAP